VEFSYQLASFLRLRNLGSSMERSVRLDCPFRSTGIEQAERLSPLIRRLRSLLAKEEFAHARAATCIPPTISHSLRCSLRQRSSLPQAYRCILTTRWTKGKVQAGKVAYRTRQATHRHPEQTMRSFPARWSPTNHGPVPSTTIVTLLSCMQPDHTLSPTATN
jgi:hypothetical protein